MSGIHANIDVVNQSLNRFQTEIAGMINLVSSVPLDTPLSKEVQEILQSKIKVLWEDRINLALAVLDLNDEEKEELRSELAFDVLRRQTLSEFKTNINITIDNIVRIKEAELLQLEQIESLENNNNKDARLKTKLCIKSLQKGRRDLNAFAEAVENLNSKDSSGTELATYGNVRQSAVRSSGASTRKNVRNDAFQAAGALVGTIVGVALAAPTAAGVFIAGTVSGLGMGASQAAKRKGNGVAEKLVMGTLYTGYGAVVGALAGVASAALSLHYTTKFGKIAGEHVAKRAANNEYRSKCDLLYSIAKLENIVRKNYDSKYTRIPTKLRYAQLLNEIQLKHKKIGKRV